MRILLVEDEIDLATAVQRGLRQQGYAVDVANDGVVGWELAELNAYDLLILDLNLPGIDGIELCRRVRTSQPKLLILMLTARSSPDDRIAGLDIGADDYLIKPFHFGELVARVRALLRRDLRGRTPLLTCGALKLDPASQRACAPSCGATCAGARPCSPAGRSNSTPPANAPGNTNNCSRLPAKSTPFSNTSCAVRVKS